MFFAFGAQQSIFPAKCTLRVVILKTFIIFVKKMCQKIQIIVSTNNWGTICQYYLALKGII